MRLTDFKILSLLFITISMSYGCATSQKHILNRTSLQGKGIVVARVGTLSPSGYEQFLSGNAHIDGNNYPASIENGYLAVSLEPGKHSFDEMFVKELTRVVTYPVNREFEIKPGHVTNLGRLLLVKDSKKKGRYIIVSIDNTEQITSYLKADKPEIYGDLEPSRIITSGKFVDDKLLAVLRNQFAAAAVKSRLGLTKRTENSFIVYGGLGTLMEMKLDAGNKKVTGKTQLDTKTYDSIKNCRSRASITACLTESDAQQTGYVYDGKSLSRSPLAAGVNYRKIYIEHDQGVIFLGDDLSIVRSGNLGKTWKRDDRFKVETDEPSTLRSAVVTGGVYFYTSQSSRVLHYSATTSAFSSLPDTDEVETAAVVLPTTSGVFLLPENSPFFDSKLLLLAPGASEWQALDINTNGCSKIRTLDKDKGVALEMECFAGLKKIVLQSQDTGKNWVEKSSEWM